MGYYRYIKGKRYDHQLLEGLDKLIEGKKDGRISLKDAEQLIHAALDGGTITQVEKDTLVYIYDNYKWTDKAKAFFDAEFPRKEVSVETILEKLIHKEFELPKLKVHIDPIEIKRQTSQYDNTVSFEKALAIALESFITDAKNRNSLRNVSKHIHGLGSGNVDRVETLLTAMVKTQLNDAEIVLIPSDQDLDEDAEFDFKRPEGKESIAQYWIFGLRVYDLVGHYFWAVVDRQNTSNHYNYGLN